MKAGSETRSNEARGGDGSPGGDLKALEVALVMTLDATREGWVYSCLQLQVARAQDSCVDFFWPEESFGNIFKSMRSVFQPY